MQNNSRSLNASLDEGSTDGKYRKNRPDTQVDGYDATASARRHLHPDMNWGTQVEAPAMLRPDGVVASRQR